MSNETLVPELTEDLIKESLEFQKQWSKTIQVPAELISSLSAKQTRRNQLEKDLSRSISSLIAMLQVTGNNEEILLKLNNKRDELADVYFRQGCFSQAVFLAVNIRRKNFYADVQKAFETPSSCNHSDLYLEIENLSLPMSGQVKSLWRCSKCGNRIFK